MATRMAVPSLLALSLTFGGCDSSTGPKVNEDPRWSGPPREVSLQRSFELANASPTEAITVRFDTPDLEVSRNVVVVVRSETHPVVGVDRAVNGMPRVAFEIQLPPGGETHLEITWDLTLRRFDALADTTGAPLLGSADATAYLEAADRIESDHPAIQATAEEVTMGLAGSLAMVQAIVGFVRDHLDYELQTETRGALWALENGRGDCTEYATLAVALAQAADIPARVTGVENMVSTSGSSTYDNHSAAEFWVEGSGWTPVDVNYAQSPVGVIPIRSVFLRWGLMTPRDRESHAAAWYTWRTVSGPTGQLQVRNMGHVWEEG